MNRINIIIADDHPVLRLGLKAMFESTSRINVVGEARGGAELLEKTKHLEPHLILLDYFLGEEKAEKLTRNILRIRPKTKILIFSYSSEPIIIQKCLRTGVAGFVSKSENQSGLVDAIYAIMSGKKYFSPSIRPIIEQLKTATDHKVQELTRREFEIVEYVAKELTNKEIAAKLHISPRTVETHKRNIMQKLRIKNSIGLVNYYFRVLNPGVSSS